MWQPPYLIVLLQSPRQSLAQSRVTGFQSGALLLFTHSDLQCMVYLLCLAVSRVSESPVDQGVGLIIIGPVQQEEGVTLTEQVLLVKVLGSQVHGDKVSE